MKIHELPTHSLRSLAQRCLGYNAVAGDGRVCLKAVTDACHSEIERRVEGGDFPLVSDEAAKKLDAEIRTSGLAEFARLLFELDE
jgi:hypothetical protein